MCTCKFSGKKTCHCAQCHETFASLNSFDWHQKLFQPYGPVCLDPRLVLHRDGSRVLFQGLDGYWRERRTDIPSPAEKFRKGGGAAASG